jgi:hypothetical protein
MLYQEKSGNPDMYYLMLSKWPCIEEVRQLDITPSARVRLLDCDRLFLLLKVDCITYILQLHAGPFYKMISANFQLPYKQIKNTELYFFKLAPKLKTYL